MFRNRSLSLRAYDESGTMVAAEVVNGREIEGSIRRLLADDGVGYLHVHNAGPGCYDVRVERA